MWYAKIRNFSLFAFGGLVWQITASPLGVSLRKGGTEITPCKPDLDHASVGKRNQVRFLISFSIPRRFGCGIVFWREHEACGHGGYSPLVFDRMREGAGHAAEEGHRLPDVARDRDRDGSDRAEEPGHVLEPHGAGPSRTVLGPGCSRASLRAPLRHDIFRERERHRVQLYQYPRVRPEADLRDDQRRPPERPGRP